MKRFITSQSTSNDNAISVTEYEYDLWSQAGNSIDGFAEFCLLCEKTSEFLLLHDRCIFHSVAISFRNKSWLIAAGSGVGKSTLCKRLTDTHPDEITVINGDKPALQHIEGAGILVHPSPWNGKEGWRGAQKAPLAGVFLLQRGVKNEITKASSNESVTRILLSIFQSFSDEITIRKAGLMTERIINSVPIWKLTCNDAQETADLVYQSMLKEFISEL